MASDLPDEFDLVVIGTGFPESCIAAAASRIGKTVLHIDPNHHYGGSWASFNLETLEAFLGGSKNQAEVRNGSIRWYVSDCESQEVEEGSGTSSSAPWTKERLLEQSRRFNLDLCPKILYSSGELVQLLISSNICRYAEFRAVDCVCTPYDGRIVNVPCSRSDVFNTKELTIVEKRLLMKFLTMCMTFGEDKVEEDLYLYKDRTFREYLAAQKVTEKINSCVMQAIAMCSDDTSFEEGMQRTKRFLHSLGRYGNTPFIFPMYGSGEIPQCFCRLCAVFGGIYCLNRQVQEVTIHADTKCATVVVEGTAIKAQRVVSSHGNLPESVILSGQRFHGFGELFNSLSRGIFLTAAPLGNEELNAGGGGVNLMRLTDGNREAIMIQLAHFSGVTPKGIYVFHLTTPALSDNPEADLKPFCAQIFSTDSSRNANLPSPLFSACFTLTSRLEPPGPVDAEIPIFCTAGPFYELDYELSIKNAQEIFAKLYGPTAEFLPRAPDPEEIVIEGEDPRALNEGDLPEDLRQQLRELEISTQDAEME